MLIPRAAWINQYDTREFEYSAEDYTVSLEGIFGYIRPNTRGARVTNSNGEEMVVQDPGIIDAYLRYNGEKIYLVLRFVLLYGIVIQSVFLADYVQVWRADGNYYNWEWQPAINYAEDVRFFWCSANVNKPNRLFYRDDYRNLTIYVDENLNPPVEQVFPYEIVLAGTDNQNLHNKSAYSIDWRVNSFSSSLSYIPWQDIPLSGTLNYADCYRWGGFGGGYPLPTGAFPPLRHIGASFEYQMYPGIYQERSKPNSRYIFNPYDSLQPYEVAIELALGEEPEQCDIPISVDPIYRDRDYFCMSFGEYNQLMNRFPQMNQSMDTTNNLLRG